MQQTKKLLSFALYTMLVAGVAACTSDDDYYIVPEDGNEARIPLTLSVTDGGYANSSATAPRTVENGYSTVFTDGDRIGILVKSTLNGVFRYQSIPFTYNAASGWTTAGNFYYDTSAIYTAYYPYTAAVVDEQSYDSYVANFVPKDDQSAYADYTGSDLMTGAGVVGSIEPNGKRPLSITLTHQMMLAVVEMPKAKYITPTADGKVTYHSQAIFTPPVTWSNLSKPYLTAPGTYRYLVKSPNASKSLVGSYENSGTNSFVVNLASSIPKGQYKIFWVDKGMPFNDQVRPLAVGDFYYSDGSVLPGDAISLPPGCVGVVYWLGNIKGDNYGLLDNKFPGGTHALAMSLRDLINPIDLSSERMIWTNSNILSGTEISDWLAKGGWASNPPGLSSIKPLDKMQGYANTLVLNEFNKSLGGDVNNMILPLVALDKFKVTNPAPVNSSGWYWPSWRDIYIGNWTINDSSVLDRELIDQQVLRAGGVPVVYEYYWTSTEHANYFFCVVNFFQYGYVAASIQLNFRVRAIIAF